MKSKMNGFYTSPATDFTLSCKLGDMINLAKCLSTYKDLSMANLYFSVAHFTSTMDVVDSDIETRFCMPYEDFMKLNKCVDERCDEYNLQNIQKELNCVYNQMILYFDENSIIV